jgi:hypothetical protein
MEPHIRLRWVEAGDQMIPHGAVEMTCYDALHDELNQRWMILQYKLEGGEWRDVPIAGALE